MSGIRAPSTRAAVLAGLLALATPAGAAEALPPGIARMALVPFETSPFPYDGINPAKNEPFLNVEDGGRRGHKSPRGGTYWADQTYSDTRTLIAIPRGFDPKRPALIVVFLHGNRATLARDVAARQQVPRQFADARLNAVLVAPQFAVDALDSSAGRFWEPGVFGRYLAEASERAALLDGRPAARGALADAPVVLVAYSGGYFPAASALALGGAGRRIAGVILMDALYGEIPTFEQWIANRGRGFFVSTYSKSSQEENAGLAARLGAAGTAVAPTLPKSFAPSSVSFQFAGDVPHNDFVTRAWTVDPLRSLLARIPGFARR